MKSKVCIVTSVHRALDSRIFYKEAVSLAAAGHDIVLIGRHDKEETIQEVKLLPLSTPKTRLSRFTGLPAVFKSAYKQKADIYHFHDPELLLLGPWLKLLLPTKLVFDIHENVAEQIMDKDWIPRVLRRFTGLFYRLIERLLLLFIDAVIIAEDSYLPNYRNFKNVICIHNYPLLTDEPPTRNSDSLAKIVYVGGVSRVRGAMTMVSAIELIQRTHQVKMVLAGPFTPPKLQDALNAKVTEAHLEKIIDMPGRVPFSSGQELIRSAGIGLACLHPVPNQVGSVVTKLFEYMIAGLPIVASNFPLWDELFTEVRCGLTVDPVDPEDIARAVTWLIDHPDQALEMGSNGRRAVLREYNWTFEKDKLVSLYSGFFESDKRESSVAQGRAKP